MSTSNRLKHHYSFTQKESQQYILTGGIIGLIMFFFIWKDTDFMLITGILALLTISLASIGSIYCFVALSKIIAIRNGYTATYEGWMNGLLVGFIISFVTYGFFPLFFPGIIKIQTIDRLRHGHIFSGENKKDIFSVLSTAILTSILIAVIGSFFYIATGWIGFYYFQVTNALIAFYAALPLPNNIGLHLFHSNKNKYLLVLFFALIFMLLSITQAQFAFFGGIGGAIVLWIIYNRFFKHYI